MLIDVTDPSEVIKAELAARRKRGAEPASQTQLANLTGFSWRQWTERMRGRVPWRLDEAERIARVLEIPLARLTEEPRP